MTIRGWSDAWLPVFEALGQLRVRWPSRGWSWDTRLSCVTSSFSVAAEAAARSAAQGVFPQEWTGTTLANAPPLLRDVVERAGGIRPGQYVYSIGPVAGLLAFGLWWPWGDGETVSLRVGLADVDPNREPSLRFRDTFGVTM